MNALDVLCAKLARDLFAIAKFLLTIGKLLLHCLYSLGTPVTICTPMVLSVFDDWYSVPFVETVKRQSNSKKMTIGVPIVKCLHKSPPNTRNRANALPCETCIICAWAVATARRPWAGLTVCVYMDVHASGSRSLPRAATLSSTF